jgi:hypothetical protein
MTTIDRINNLLVRADLPKHRANTRQLYLHDTLNMLDSAIGADTEWLSSLECQCLWHIGKSCDARRAVGARVRMLEEIVALNDLKAQFAVCGRQA